MKTHEFKALMECLNYSYASVLLRRELKISFNRSQFEELMCKPCYHDIQHIGRFNSVIKFVGDNMVVDYDLTISTYNLSVLLLRETVEANELNLYRYE